MQTTAVVFIPLGRGRVTVIDFEDFEKVRGLKWYAHKCRRGFHAFRTSKDADGKTTTVYLHRLITACPPELEVNHKNGDGLNNKRKNLKVCTHLQNISAFQRKRQRASSIYRGVCWRGQDSCWRARIMGVHIGYFRNEIDAARAYDAKAIELFGEFASPNFP